MFLYFMAFGVFGLIALGMVWKRHSNTTSPLMPEGMCKIEVTSDFLACSFPDGTLVQVRWKDIVLIKIKTTDDGPWGTDVLWGFHTANSNPALVIPGGATGELTMLEALKNIFPTFDEEIVRKAMGSTSNAEFICWKA